MDDKLAKKDSENWLKDIPLQSESESYDSNELINCNKCNRTNPPTRLDCMYCGKQLEFDEDQSQSLKPVIHKIEQHLNGFNLIYLGNLESYNDRQVNEVTKMTRQSNEVIRELFESKKTLPIARAETEKETQIVATRLKEIGIETTIIRDDVFQIKNVSKRLRGIEFDDDKLVLKLFNTDEEHKIHKENVSLFVVGVLFERKVESTEKYKKKTESKVLDRAEISSDEVLIDIYSKDNPISFRISPKGFDFSFLGDEKKLLAMENVKVLVNKLKDFSPNAVFDDSYVNFRSNLAEVWEVEEEIDLKGIERKSFGTFNKQSVTKTSNLTQFTKYSRLQWMLINSNF